MAAGARGARAARTAARRQLAIHGEALLHETLAVLVDVKAKLNAIDGITVVGENVIGTGGVAAHDPLRLVLDTRELGATGYEVAEALREIYDVQVEPGKAARQHTHTSPTVVVLDKGDVNHGIGNESKHLAKPGDWILVPAGSSHTISEQRSAASHLVEIEVR